MISMPTRPRASRFVVGAGDVLFLVAPPDAKQSDLEMLVPELRTRYPRLRVVVVPHGFAPHIVQAPRSSARGVLRRGLRDYWERLGERWPR